MLESEVRKLVVLNYDDLLFADWPGLVRWANRHKIKGKKAWLVYKSTLKEFGIDFNKMQMRHDKDLYKENFDIISNPTHKLELFADFSLIENRFCLTDITGSPVWYGRIKGRSDQEDFVACAVVCRAVRFAEAAARAISNQSLRLDVKISSKFMGGVFHNQVCNGGLLSYLWRYAMRKYISLTVLCLHDEEYNPAQQYTVRGYKFLRWRRNDFVSLVSEVS